MGQPAENRQRPETYADLAAVPEHMLAELIGGILHTFPRPSPVHTSVASGLGFDLGGPFDRGRGGPGGWRILDEPEMHLGPDVLVPDLAGWRKERMPDLPETAHFTLPPDWVCEVLSPSTATHDRVEKMPVYARAGVTWLWLVDPLARSLELYHLGPRGRWEVEQMVRGDATVHAAPFDAIALDLSTLWPRPAGREKGDAG